MKMLSQFQTEMRYNFSQLNDRAEKWKKFDVFWTTHASKRGNTFKVVRGISKKGKNLRTKFNIDAIYCSSWFKMTQKRFILSKMRSKFSLKEDLNVKYTT